MANSRSSSNITVQGVLPCGNPKRFTSADVVQMQKVGKKNHNSSLDGNPNTEGNQYIQTLIQHQTRTDITLKEQFSQHRRFIQSSSHAPTIEQLDGLHSSDEHVQFKELDTQVDYLKSCGLTAREIAFKLSQESSSENVSSCSKGFGADPASERLIAEEIDRKLLEKEEALKKPDRFNGGLELSRQALILEKSILERQNNESKLANCLFRQKESEFKHPDDPINHIPEILSQIESRPIREPRRERRRKRKLNDKLLRQQKYLCAESNPDAHIKFMKSVGLEPEFPEILNHEDDNINGSSDIKIQNVNLSQNDSGDSNLKADLNAIERNNKPIDPDEHKGDDTNTNKIKKKKKKTSSKSKSCGSFTMSSLGSTNVSFWTDEEVRAKKLSLQDIVKIDKFQNYDKGSLNKIVYVKNLPNDVDERDLISLFGPFQQDDAQEISFRLLNGRMKGQAFVTFPDEETAEMAISKLNGFKWRGKPVILSFGKKQEEDVKKTLD